MEDDKVDKADSEYLAIDVKVLRYSSKAYDFKSSQVFDLSLGLEVCSMIFLLLFCYIL